MKWFSILKKSKAKPSVPEKLIPIKIRYSGESFTEFAEKNDISRDKLFRLNDKRLKKYEKITDNVKRESFKKKLQGSDLIVGYKSTGADIITDSDTKPYLTNNITDNGDKRLSFEKNEYQKSVKTSSQENRIIARIDEIEYEVSRIREKNRTLEGIITSFIEKEKLTSQLNETRIQLNKEISEKQALEDKLVIYADKVILTEFLVQFAEIAEEYFNMAETVYNKTLELYRKLSNNKDENCSVILGQLLMKYNLSLPPDIGTWKEILKEIKNKVTSSPDLINSFRQIVSEEEKLKEFKRILFRDNLKKHASCTLILTEELSNLSKFINGNEAITREYENYFSDISKSLHGKIVNLGLDFKYVPLFTDSKEYMGFTQRINQECSLPYKNVLQTLQKNSILEIISYSFDENEKTKIILV